LNINYDEDLPGSTKAEKARELVARFERRKRIHKLIEKIDQLRDDISRDDLSEDKTSPPDNQGCKPQGYISRTRKDIVKMICQIKSIYRMPYPGFYNPSSSSQFHTEVV